MDKKTKLIIAMVVALITGCSEKKPDKYNTIRLTNDKNLELAAAFIGEKGNGVGYTSRNPGGWEQSIYATQIDSHGKKVVKPFKSFLEERDPNYSGIHIVDDHFPKENFNINHMWGLGKIIVAPVSFYNINKKENMMGVAMINPDGSPIDGKDYKIVFESEDCFVYLEGCLNGKLYFSARPMGANREDAIYELSLDGKITKIDKLPELVEKKQEIISNLKSELGVDAVYDFKAKEGNITDVLAGWYKKDKFWKPKQWDLYIFEYQDFKSKQKISDKSGRLEDKTNYLLAQQQYGLDGTLKSIASFNLKEAIEQKNYKLQGGRWYR